MKEFFYQIDRNDVDSMRKICALHDLRCDIFYPETSELLCTAHIQSPFQMSERYIFTLGGLFAIECDIARMTRTSA